MKIAFIGIGYEHLSISILSSLAKKFGHQTHLTYFSAMFNDMEFPQFRKFMWFLNDYQNGINSLKRINPDVIAISAVTNTYLTQLGILMELKKYNPGIKTIVGGPHASAVPQRVIENPYIDFVVIGEGDIAFIKILEAIEKGEDNSPIENTWFKNNDGNIIKGIQKGFVQDLDTLPQFDKDIWAEHLPMGELYVTMTSRGCPFKCSYCFNNYFKNIPEENPGKYLRRRSVGHVMEELISSKKRYNIKYIDFWDDVFTFDKKWLGEFLYRFKKEINVPFKCYAHTQYFDADVAKMLKEAGCEWTTIGVQSLDENYKKKWLCRKETNEDVARTLSLMDKFKIKSKADFIIGLPGEPIEAKNTAINFFAKNTPTYINVFWFSYFPGTELTKMALNQNIITSERYESICNGQEQRAYRRNDVKLNKKEARYLKSVSYLLRIYPRLPYFIRTKLSAQTMAKVPLLFKRTLLPMHIITLILNKEPRTIYFFKHTLFQFKKLVILKLKKHSNS